MTEPAPAKVNLTLHVTGRRADGYHLLDSLVVFADIGDRVTVRPGASCLRVLGPMAAAVPVGPENLVLRAAALMNAEAEITLDKHLPASAGIGGGSSDAAACLRALARLTGARLPDDVARLGADVPVCLLARAARMRGIGEEVTPLARVPLLHAVLVNSRVAVSTPAIFKRLARRDNPPMPERLPGWHTAENLIRWLTTQRNDLEESAIAEAPVIAEVLPKIAATEGCALARMSGSGATCFGLYPDPHSAQQAADVLRRDHPDWWVMPARLS
ncbi:4-(cytidine 5'-diphospho)-2-C-methyl-D-erythritol kinase [Roseovarius sp. A-2]|uniref:4-(cytidine 5'-diphospho)-2-C-methyl-D-erythritol kinase n=1 Tax=Roseovarius sp. A-2 TaxID=1570360 RepID=UPI0009B59596|nr:4-(cytidine 5'-diphospho)-2-C-methyl-D-erythritol kinase [Roseovarius sp. A-2]